MSKLLRTELKNFFSERVSFGEPLKKYTSFAVGGPADYMVTVESVEELKKVLALTKNYQQPFFLLGKGTNVLVSDRGIR